MARRAPTPAFPGPAVGQTVLRRTGLILALVCLAALAGCEPEPEKPPTEKPADRAVLTPADFADLPGWSADRHAEALPALLRSCRRFQKLPMERPLGPAALGGTTADILPACAAAAGLPAGDNATVRRFF